ncbi:MAG: LLM class flavin-dependent oxidoreductase [Myxococcales bacterium]|nr:LLM class flavin-dependent oxidoreductase [Myxococcales bacterium]
MKFGIFYEHQLPRPWDEGAELKLFQEALDQVEFADKMGIDMLWEVEHHFLEEYSHSSAPEVFLAACSQRTKNIRLGHGIIQTAPAYNHPARTAERLATLDLVSNGRVEFGSGESSSRAELRGFRIEPEAKRAMWREGLEITLRCMTEEPFGGVKGQYVEMPPRNVVPKPVQKPHPPLWVACSRRDTILMAAREGMGALTFSFIDPEEARGWVQDYEKELEEKCVPIGLAINPQVACVSPMMLHHDAKEAVARGLEGGNFFGYSLAHFYIFGKHVPGKTDVWQEFQEKRSEMGYSPEVEEAVKQETLGAKIASGEATGLRGAVGTPDQLREYIRRYEDAGVDQLIFVMQAGRNKHEHIMESLEIFGKEVMPEFKERDEKLVAKKRERLQPILDKAMARRIDNAPKMPENYTITPMVRRMMESRMGEEAVEKLQKAQATGAGGGAFGMANRRGRGGQGPGQG